MAEKLKELLASQFVKMMTQAAIRQDLAMEHVAQAMLVDAIAILANVYGASGRAQLATFLRAAADTVETPPAPVG